MGNFAAIDCGTLTTRLLVSDPRGAPIVRLSRVTGLGRGVDKTRELDAGPVERALSVLREYRGLMDDHEVTTVRMVGTSALRDAANRESFSQPAEQIVGAPLGLLKGEEEAALSYLGSTAELGDGPWLMADIGGGSTELAVGPSEAVSLDLGSVRVTERFLHDDPPALEQLAGATSWLGEQFSRAQGKVPRLAEAKALVGLAGTVSALACFDQGLVAYDHDAVHHYWLTRPAAEAALAALASCPAAERAGLPGVEAARAPFIVGGALVLVTLMAHFGFAECLVSEADILDGLIIELVRPV